MPRFRWAVRCHAHRSTDGAPCLAWAIRGGYCCSAHSGRLPQVRQRAEYRLWRVRLETWFRRRFGEAMAELAERRERDPDGWRAEILDMLDQVREQAEAEKAAQARLDTESRGLIG